MPIRNTYTFESYVPGNNRAAWEALLKAANDPGVYTPLCLYGAPGCGKTHLLQAVYKSLQVNFPDAKILYATCESFCNGLIEALEGKAVDLPKQYIEHFMKQDCLILEDVQILMGKKSTTQTLFGIFDVLHGQGKQIVFSCSEFPDKLEGLEDTYISRYPQTLMLELRTPDCDTRRKIIESKAEEMHLVLSDDVKVFLTKTIGPGVRAIEGSLAVLSAKYQKATGSSFVDDIDAVRAELKCFVH